MKIFYLSKMSSHDTLPGSNTTSSDDLILKIDDLSKRLKELEKKLSAQQKASKNENPLLKKPN